MPKKAQRSDGRYAVQVYLGKDENDKRKYKTVYGKTQKEANRKAAELKLKMSKGVDVASENMPFKYYKDMYLSQKKATNGDKSYRAFAGHAAHFDHLDAVPIKDITELALQSVIDELAEMNPTTHKPTAKKTLCNIKTCAKKILSLAQERGAIYRNVANLVIIPKQSPAKKREALSEEQMRWIDETPHRAQTAAMIMLYAGLRRGELTALEWSDVDLEKKTISINKASETINKMPVLKIMPKTDAGFRTVFIPDKLVNYLLTVPRTSSLVFPNTEGHMMSDRSWEELWHSYMFELNWKYGDFEHKGKYKKEYPILIKTFTAHELRHSFATLLYLSETDILSAKEQLGHKDVTTTLNIYTHLDYVFKKRSVNKLNDYLCKSNASQENSESVDT